MSAHRFTYIFRTAPVLLYAIVCVATAWAGRPLPVRIDTFHPYMNIKAGQSLSDTLPAAYNNLDAHLRFAVRPEKGFDLSLLYDYADSANYRCIRITRAPGNGAETLMAQAVSMVISTYIDAVETESETLMISRGLDAGARQFSLKLVTNDYGALAIIGQDKEVAEHKVPFSGVGNSLLIWQSECDIELVRHTLAYSHASEATFSRFASRNELDDYLDQSSDPREGYWMYLDRDTRPSELTLGGNYLLATVRTDAGYDLLYIDGASANADAWKPMQIKGHLIDTGFIDQYDLQWRDAFGQLHTRDLSARLSTDHTLTLNFPLHHSKIRFRRLTPTR